MPSPRVAPLQTWRHAAGSSAPGFHPEEDSQGNLPATRQLSPGSVRLNRGRPGEQDGGEDARRRKRRKKERELMEAQCDAGGGAGGGERTGVDIQGAGGSGDPAPSRTGSSEGEAAVGETTKRMKTRCRDERTGLGGEGGDGFEGECGRAVP